MSTVFPADSATARELIAASDGIVLVDFTAAWCPPCRALAPVLDELVVQNRDLTVLTVDVDRSPELGATHRVASMPTLIFFVRGQPVRRLVGARGLPALREELEQLRATASESGTPATR